MDLDTIQQEELAILREMDSRGGTQRAVAAEGHAAKLLRDTTAIQKQSDAMKLAMLQGDRSISMAEMVKADARAQTSFDTTSMLVKKMSEGLKTVLNTPL